MNITLKTRLSLVIGLLALISMAVGLLGLNGIGRSNGDLQQVYQHRTVALEKISRIDRLLLANRLALSEALQDPDAEKTASHTALIAKNAAEITQAWNEYMDGSLLPDERRLRRKFCLPSRPHGAGWFIPGRRRIAEMAGCRGDAIAAAVPETGAGGAQQH